MRVTRQLEQGRVGAAGNAVMGRGAVGICSEQHGDIAFILANRDRGLVAAAIGDEGDSLVHVGHGHRNRQIVVERAVARADDDLIDAVAIGIERKFEIRRAKEEEMARRRVDPEQRGVRAAGQEEAGLVAIDVAGGHLGHIRGVLLGRYRGARGDRDAFIDVVDHDLHQLEALRSPSLGDVDAVEVARILEGFHNPARGEAQHARHGSMTNNGRPSRR